MPPDPKILVIALSGIGDTLVATPFIHELRALFPSARIDVVVLWAGSKGLLENNPHIASVHQHNFIQSSKWDSLKFVGSLRRQNYDVSFNVHTQGRLEYRLIARMIGAPIRASHEYEGHSWLDRRCVTFSVPQDYTVHSVTNNCRLLGAIGRTPILPDDPYELYLSDAEQDFARGFMAQHQLIDGAVMGVHVGSGGTKNLRYKRWPLPRWLEFLALFRRAHPTYPILFFGGPEEVEAHREIQARFPNAGFYFPSTKNMRQAGALIQKCRVFLSVDTALMHVAAAVRPQRQVVIEAPTLNPTNTPWQARWEIVPNPKLNGRSLDYYRYDGGPIRGTPSELEALMSSVTPEAVFQVVDRAL